ncbi:HTH-type sugar sensing transcriptional regulator TrmBL1 [uncultured archaeon]|nr:HTH-type sugar sensing transcriptional regulator TrmBL1 [uncultured archaeon]
MADFERLLTRMGLSAAEAKAYLSLLEIGPSPAGKIASQAGLYRKNAYDALARLAEKGLVTSALEGSVKYFQAKGPENLSNYLEEKKKRIELEGTALSEALPSLKRRIGAYSRDIEAEIYRGNDGIKTILNECLNVPEVLFIGATGDVESRLQYFWPQYNEKREKKKVLWKLLLVHESRNRRITKSKHYEYKVLPKALSGPNVIYIYGDSVANVLWLEKPLAFVVRHRELAESYRRHFHYLWKITG